MGKLSKNIVEGAKSIGGCALGIAISAGIGLLAIVLLKGGVSLADKIFPYLVKISTWVLLVLIFVLIPMAYFKKTKAYAGVGLYITSYFFGFSMWMYSALVVYVSWGLFVMFIGLFLFGVGVLPIAILASIFNGEWSVLGQLIYLIGLTYGSRIIGLRIVEKAEQETYPENSSLLNTGNYEGNVIEGEIVSEEETQTTKRFCSNCGNEIVASGNFCKFCGKTLNKENV